MWKVCKVCSVARQEYEALVARNHERVMQYSVWCGIGEGV